MSDLPQQQQGSFTPGAAREALRYLRQRGKGSLLVTSGMQDVRLVVGGRRVTLEAEGLELFGEEKRDLVRHFLCSLFWEEPSFFIDPEGLGGSASSAISLEASPFEVLNLMDRGIVELKALYDRVPGIDLMVSVSGEGPPEGIESPTARLFRILARMPKGGHLASAAEAADLDELDAAWSVSDLMDAGQATVRRPPPNLSLRRLLHAEAYAENGLMPALRYGHLARGLTRGEPRRAARLYLDAANAYLVAGFPEQAMMSYRACLELSPENVAALEGLAGALDQLHRAADARRIRERLVKLYVGWGMPARARAQLEQIPKLDAEQQELLLDCMLKTGDFAGALTVARRLLPARSGSARTELAQRFAAAGARGKELDAIVRAAGLRSQAPLRSLFKSLTVVSLIGAVLLGCEVALRAQFARAGQAVLAAARRGDFAAAAAELSTLSAIDTTLGASAAQYPFTCLAGVGKVLEDLDALAADVARLRRSPRDLELLRSWEAPGDLATRPLDEEYPHLLELSVQAKSRHLRQRIQEAIDRIEARRREAEEKVKAYEGLTKRLAEAKELLTAYANVRRLPGKPDLYLDGDGRPLTLTVRVNLSPKGGALYRVENGKEKRYRDPATGSGVLVDTWEVRLPLARADEGLELIATHPDGYVPQRRRLKIVELEDTEVEFRLLRSVRHPDRRLEKPPVLPGRKVRVFDKKGKAFDYNLRKQKPPVESCSFRPTDLSFLEPLLTERHQLVVRFVNNSKPFGKRVYMSSVDVWLEDVESGREAAPRQIGNIGTRLFPDGIRRPLVEVRPGRYEALPLEECKEPAGRWDLVKQALEFTVRAMLEELR